MSWLNCGVTTQAPWPKEKKEVKYGGHTFVLMPLTKDHSASIHIELRGISDVEGLTLINRFLSALGWKCDEPASIIMVGAETQFLRLFPDIRFHLGIVHLIPFQMNYTR